MELVAKECFNDVEINVFGQNQEYFLSRIEIGEALGYANPQKAIDKIHSRHRNILDKFSTTPNLGGVEGNRIVYRDIIMYSFRGVIEICRWSHQPKAEEFIDKIYCIMYSSVKQLRAVIDDQQKQLIYTRNLLATIREDNQRLHNDYLEEHESRKRYKEDNKRLARVVELMETEEGRISKSFLDAVKMALTSCEYAIVPSKGRKVTSRHIIGVYDNDYLYLSSRESVDIYNLYSSQSLKLYELRHYLMESGTIPKCPVGSEPKKSINGERVECFKISVRKCQDIVNMQL